MIRDIGNSVEEQHILHSQNTVCRLKPAENF